MSNWSFSLSLISLSLYSLTLSLSPPYRSSTHPLSLSPLPLSPLSLSPLYLSLPPTAPSPGEEEGRMATGASDHRRTATLPGGFDPVVERELRALGSRPPGSGAAGNANANTANSTAAANSTQLDPSHPARQAPLARGCLPPIRHLGVEPLMRASHANLALPAAQGSEESVCVGSDYYGSMFSLYRGRTFSMPL